MSEVTLKVPAEHVEVFRAGMTYEVKDNAEWVDTHQSKVTGCHVFDEEDPRDRFVPSPGDVQSSKRHLDQSVRILDQMFSAKDGQPVVVEASAYEGSGVLSNALRGMVEHVIVPKLASLSNISPLDGEIAEAMGRLADAIRWAVSEAPRLEAHGVEAGRAEYDAKSGSDDPKLDEAEGAVA